MFDNENEVNQWGFPVEKDGNSDHNISNSSKVVNEIKEDLIKNELFDAHILENSINFNSGLAIIGLGVTTILKQTAGDIASSASNMVFGAYGYCMNRFFKSKGDESAYTYSGQLVGGVQFTIGFMLVAIEAVKINTKENNSGPLLKTLDLVKTALSVSGNVLQMLQVKMYADGSSKISESIGIKKTQ